MILIASQVANANQTLAICIVYVMNKIENGRKVYGKNGLVVNNMNRPVTAKDDVEAYWAHSSKQVLLVCQE